MGEGKITKHHVALSVTGMRCGNCALNIEKNISKLPGVNSAVVNFAGETLTIEYQGNRKILEDVVSQVKQLGFFIVVREIKINFPTVHDIFLGGQIAAQIKENIHLVLNAHFDIAENCVYLNVLVSSDTQEIIEKVLQKLGYQYELVDDDFYQEKIYYQEAQKQKKQVVLAVVFTLPLLVLSMARDFGSNYLSFLTWTWQNVIFMLLAFPVQFWLGRDFFKGAYSSLKAKSANMDVLVSLGSLTAFLYSGLVLTNSHAHVYFETSAMIITLIKVGKYLESRAKYKTNSALHGLLKLQPKFALVLRGEHEVKEKVSNVKIDEILVLRPGEIVPLDGVIIDGQGAFDESLVTGESLPVERFVGNQVVAGSTNTNGFLKVQVKKVEAESFIRQIIKIVAEAQGSKAPIAQLADKISAYFVPLVIFAALLTLGLWLLTGANIETALVRMIAVIVIACPCALGLATPTAIMVGMGIGAKRGVLFKNSESLQRLSEVTVLLLDKTGTVTQGILSLSQVLAAPKKDRTEVLRLAASLESGSEHPIARAMVIAAKEQQLSLGKLEQFKNYPGFGVSGSVEGNEYYLGTKAFLKNQGVHPDCFQEVEKQIITREQSTVYLASQGEIIGLITLEDKLRPEAFGAIKKLLEYSSVVLLTGDLREVAQRIGKELGLKEFFAEVKPEDKLEKVVALQVQGEVVAMVGDGVNDAPALTKADVGIAMGSGTEIAKSSAGVTLVHSNLMSLVAGIALSKATIKTIRLNFVWAFFYNILLIPIAAGAFSVIPQIPLWLKHFHPIMAALAMSLSSLFVVLNSLLLNKRFGRLGL